MSYNYLPLDRKHTSFQQIKNLLAFDQLVSITFDAHEKILICREYLDKKIAAGGKSIYGVNTGFGYLQNIPIEGDQLSELQSNLLRSHACGTGEEVPRDIVKLMIALKIKSLGYGYSGVAIDTVKRLMDMFNADMLPVIYTQGSLGASGDLAPLSHLCLPLIGEGEVVLAGVRMQADAALKRLNWEALSLQSKEGLALINGTQFMSAYGLHNLLRAERLLYMADRIAALSYDAFHCLPDPLHPALHRLRKHPGQQNVAARIKKLLDGSEIIESEKSAVQDPYSFRCIPQVHGASEDNIRYVEDVLVREINSVTDNPNVFPEEDMVISGGNFHGQHLAIAADLLAIAVSELANISERRTYQLISGQRGLPAFLISNPGLHSGFMIPQYVAAGLVSENKQFCTPASVDSIPSSNNQEDHVSMGANAAVKCARVLENAEKVLAIELLTAAQAIEFRRPKKTSAALESFLTEFRKVVTFNDADRILHYDIAAAVEFLRNYHLGDG